MDEPGPTINIFAHYGQSVAAVLFDLSDGTPICRDIHYEGDAYALWQIFDLNRLMEMIPGALKLKGKLEAPIAKQPEAPTPAPTTKARSTCPVCHKQIYCDGAGLRKPHNNREGKPCPDPNAISSPIKPKRNYRRAPKNVLMLLDTKYDGSPKRLADAYGVPRTTAQGWVNAARAKQPKRPRGRAVDFSSLPLVEEDGSPAEDNPEGEPSTEEMDAALAALADEIRAVEQEMGTS